MPDSKTLLFCGCSASGLFTISFEFSSLLLKMLIIVLNQTRIKKNNKMSKTTALFANTKNNTVISQNSFHSQ